MQYIEYGTQHPETMIFLHGGGLSWWNYRAVAEQLQDSFHVILPILDGHAGSDRPFSTIQQNAAELLTFIDEQLGGSVLLIGGLSLGAQVLLELLSQRGTVCRFALVESALVIPSRLTRALIEPAFGSCYGLIRKKWFARLQFRSLRIRSDLFDDYYRDTCRLTKEDLIAFLQENAVYAPKSTLAACTTVVHLYVGSRETSDIRRSGQLLQERIPGSSLHVLPGLYHGEFSINHAQRYVEEVQNMISNAQQ